jgi:hypothetical protein
MYMYLCTYFQFCVLVGGGVSHFFMYVLCAWGWRDVSMYIRVGVFFAIYIFIHVCVCVWLCLCLCVYTSAVLIFFWLYMLYFFFVILSSLYNILCVGG